MANFKITGVRTEDSPGGTHEHITHVRIGNTTTPLTRQTVINDLRDPNGDRYYTEVDGKKADVVVVDCPTCDFRDYITTKPDSSKKNNLLNLPRI